MEHTVESDVLIIGGGLAGASAGVRLRDLGVERVCLVDKASVSRSGCSTFAAGVITAWFPEDNIDDWVRETAERGQYMSNQEWVETLYLRGYEWICQLEGWGVELEKDAQGRIARVCGRGQLPHKALRNIMFHGPQFMEMMRKQLIKRHLRLVEGVTITDLLTEGSRVVGAIGFNPREGDAYTFYSKAVIMAAGANAYKSINIGHKNITGDSHGMSFRVGAEQACFDFCTQQTCARNFDMTGLNMLVGLGGKLTNNNGDRFMLRYFPEYKEQEILPHLCGSMAMEVHRGRGPIFLDMTDLSDEGIARLRRVIPIAMQIFDDAGVDLQRDRIEWTIRPGAFSIASGGGGSVIDRDCRTTVPGLYAIGDAACTTTYNGVGDSGAQNLLWCMVSGGIAAEAAASEAGAVRMPAANVRQVLELREISFAPLNRREGPMPDDVLLQLQMAIFPYTVTVIRHRDRLERAIREVVRIQDEEMPRIVAADGHQLVKANELRNMLLCAQFTLRSSLHREESRGANLREDFPETDNVNWLRWTTVRSRGDGMEISSRPLPIERFRFRPPSERYVHPIFARADIQLDKATTAEQDDRPIFYSSDV